MLLNKKSLFGLLILLTGIGHANYLPPRYILPESSIITFVATDNLVSITGAFNNFSGQIFFSSANYKAGNMHIAINMNELTASPLSLVNVLNSPDWFNVKNYPKAEFDASHFNKLGEKTFQATGQLKIKEQSAPLTLFFTAQEKTKGGVLVEGDASFKRSSYGLGLAESANTNEFNDEIKLHFRLIAELYTGSSN